MVGPAYDSKNSISANNPTKKLLLSPDSFINLDQYVSFLPIIDFSFCFWPHLY